MTEQELRALVRDAIAQHLRRPDTACRAEALAEAGRAEGGPARTSFSQFGVPSGPEGTCIIEPSVMCNHCGYCKSYGH